jgi:hypothetical protein
VFARIAVVVALAVSLAACADDTQPGRDEIIARIQSDPRTQDTPDEAAACIADWYVTYATPEEIEAFVNGEPNARTPEQIAPDEHAEASMMKCLKGATGGQ